MPTIKKSSKASVEKQEVKIVETIVKKKPEINEETSDNESGSDIESVENVSQKKRGRKPKSKNLENEAAKIMVPKKRGRRPKDKTYTISNYKEIPNEVEEDNVILHLPVETDTTNNINENDVKIETNGMLKYDPNLCEPLPYEPLDSMRSGFAIFSDKISEKLNELNTFENEENVDNNNMRFDEKNKTNVNKCDLDEVYVRDIGFEEETKDYLKVLKKAKILKLMTADDNKKDWDLSSDSCCFNCTEKFQTVPIGIPVRYFRGKFYCKDIFCSFNCAAAYIFAGYDMRYNFKKWEYYSLLCLLASMIQREMDDERLKNNEIKTVDKKNQSIRVKIAENRNLLKKFGGPLTIEQYRKNFYVLDSQYSVLYPPLCCMYPQTEIAHYVNVHRQKAQILNNESRFSFGDNRGNTGDLRLRRDKPLIQKKNTLEEYMSLKIN